MEKKKCDKYLYIKTNEGTERCPTEGTISKDELYKLINEYLDELEIAAKLEIERMHEILNEIPKFKSK